MTKCCIHHHVNCKLQWSLAFLDWTGVLQCDQVPTKLTICHILWKETIGIKKEHFRISVSFVLPLKSFCRNGLKRNYVQSNELSKLFHRIIGIIIGILQYNYIKNKFDSKFSDHFVYFDKNAHLINP